MLMSIERFRKVYDKLPFKERDLPILIIDDEKITWNRAYREIKNGTALGRKIARKLVELEIL